MKEIGCLECGSPVSGRRDRKFCSESCKSTFHYEQRLKNDTFYFEVDRKLKTNRKLLKLYNHKGYTTVRKEDIVEDGFDPNFFTHYWKNTKGDVYLFVYDYGFLDMKKSDKPKYLIVEWQDYMRK